MRKITVTYEKTFRVQEEYEITEKEYEDILTDGIIPERCHKVAERLPLDLTGGADMETDYSVSDEDERTLIDWD